MLEHDNLQKVFNYIESSPVILLTTTDGQKNDICTISWMMPVNYSEHYYISIMKRELNHSFDTMMKTMECGICIPSSDMAEKVAGIWKCSDENDDKFAKFSLTPVNETQSKAPMICECIAGVECRVVKYYVKHGLVILECKKLWVNKEKEFLPTLHANGDGSFRTDNNKVMHFRKEMQMPVISAG